MIYITDTFKYLSVITDIVADDPIVQKLIQGLNLHSPLIQKEVRFQVDKRSVILDYVLEENDKIYVIDVKKRVSTVAVAQFYVAMELMSSDVAVQEKEHIFVIAGQDVDPIAWKLADRLGMRVQKLIAPLSNLEKYDFSEPPSIKLTSEKAWRPIVTLLRFQPTSIYDVKKRSAVSYGQAHRVVSYLKSRDLILQKGNYVSISNFKPILNAVFWERPLSSLVAKQIYVDVEKTDNIPIEISDKLHEYKIKHAFTGLLAYEKFFGGIRSATPIELYADVSNPSFQELIDELAQTSYRAPNLFICKPDRDVFSDGKTIDGLRLVSAEQLLLDLSGGDNIAIQYATEVVKHLGKV